MPAGDPTFTSGGNAAAITIHEPPPPIAFPKFGDWPAFYAPSWLRNGREAGAWLAGVVSVIPEKCAHVTVDDEQVAGAVHAMVEGGFVVQAYSVRDNPDHPSQHTFEIHSAHHQFVKPE